MARVLISGWYGYGNAGDEAILRCFINALAKHAEIFVLTNNPSKVSADHPEVRAIQHLPLLSKDFFRLLFSKEIIRHARLLKEMDLFVLGGGGIIKDSVSWRTLLMNLDDIWLAKLVGTPVALYALGISPLQSIVKRWIYGLTFKLCDLITVRDSDGALVMGGLAVNLKSIVTVADPVFALEPVAPEITSELADLTRRAEAGEIFCISTGIWFKDKFNVLSLAKALDQLYERHGARFAALPMQVLPNEVDDRQVASLIRAAMQHPECLETPNIQLDPEQLMWLMGHFHFCIASRLHAAIFSIATKVPMVAINCDPHDPKMHVVMKDAGFGEWVVDVGNDLTETLVERAENCLSDLQGCRERIEKAIPNLIEKSSVFFKLIFVYINK